MASQQFPTELPMESARQIIKFATRQDADLGRAGLAAWNLLGFAGHLAFGPVVLQPPMPQAGPTDWAATMQQAEAANAIPPELIDLALAILGRWLKNRFQATA